VAPGRSWTLFALPRAEGGPAAAVLFPAPAAAPVTADPLPAFGAHRAPAPGGRGLLGRALARPSLAAILGLVAIALFFGLRAHQLLSSGGLAAVLDVAATIGIGGVAVALLLIAGQFDLSIGAVAVGSSLVTGLLVRSAGWGIWPALAVSLAAALAVGLANGLLVVSTGLPSFLTTLATYLVLEGTTLAAVHQVSGTETIAGLSAARGWHSATAVFDSGLRLGGGRYSISLLWWLTFTAVATWTLWRTRFGNAVFAIGGARRAARELGVRVGPTTVTLFCQTATAGWLIGTLALVHSGGAQVTPGLGQEIGFVVVAVIGGCLLTGGYGSTVGAAVGALVYAVAQIGMRLAGWESRWFQTLLGGMLLVALLANGVVRSRLRAAPRS
jgi:simple sugar transport system permease protein